MEWNSEKNKLYLSKKKRYHNRVSQNVSRKEKLSASRIHCWDIILSTEFKLSRLLCNHQFRA